MRLFLTLIFGLSLAFSTPLLAGEPVAAVNKAVTSKKQAIEIAQQNVPGKVLKITEQPKTYTVRILKPKGRLIDIVIIKKDGQIKKD